MNRVRKKNMPARGRHALAVVVLTLEAALTKTRRSR